MVHVQKNKLLLASIVAVSFFGKQAQAVKGGALVHSAYQGSVSNCTAAGSMFPQFLVASVVVETACTLNAMREKRSLRTGTGCPLAGYSSEIMPGNVEAQAIITEDDRNEVIGQYNGLINNLQRNTSLKVNELQAIVPAKAGDSFKSVVTSTVVHRSVRIGRFGLHADVAEQDTKRNIVAQLWRAKWGVDLPSAKHTAATIGTLVLWSQAQKYMAKK